MAFDAIILGFHSAVTPIRCYRFAVRALIIIFNEMPRSINMFLYFSFAGWRE